MRTSVAVCFLGGEGAGYRLKRILIVEDHVELLDVLAAILEQEYEVYTASDGAQALALIDKQPVDLILLDLMMPILDGASVVRTLRSRGDQTPVILLSAVLDLARWATELQAADAFPKPFDLSELEDRIARFFRTHGPGTGGGTPPAPPPPSHGAPGGSPPRSGGWHAQPA